MSRTELLINQFCAEALTGVAGKGLTLHAAMNFATTNCVLRKDSY